MPATSQGVMPSSSVVRPTSLGSVQSARFAHVMKMRWGNNTDASDKAVLNGMPAHMMRGLLAGETYHFNIEFLTKFAKEWDVPVGYFLGTHNVNGSGTNRMPADPPPLFWNGDVQAAERMKDEMKRLWPDQQFGISFGPKFAELCQGLGLARANEVLSGKHPLKMPMFAQWMDKCIAQAKQQGMEEPNPETILNPQPGSWPITPFARVVGQVKNGAAAATVVEEEQDTPEADADEAYEDGDEEKADAETDQNVSGNGVVEEPFNPPRVVVETAAPPPMPPPPPQNAGFRREPATFLSRQELNVLAHSLSRRFDTYGALTDLARHMSKLSLSGYTSQPAATQKLRKIKNGEVKYITYGEVVAMANFFRCKPEELIMAQATLALLREPETVQLSPAPLPAPPPAELSPPPVVVPLPANGEVREQKTGTAGLAQALALLSPEGRLTLVNMADVLAKVEGDQRKMVATELLRLANILAAKHT